MTSAQATFPLRLTGELDPNVSRWQWLFKWLLAIPHFIVLFFLWIGFFLSTVFAGFAILFTGRYHPRRIFDFNVGVLRWSWRVGFYSYSALGSDKYPPFSLADDRDYPATLDVEYPARLSRGLVLVKWWLLAIPHYSDRRDLHQRRLVGVVGRRGRVALCLRRWPDRLARALRRTGPALHGSLSASALRLRARPESLGLPCGRLRGAHDRYLPAVPPRLRKQRAAGDRDRHDGVPGSGAVRFTHRSAKKRRAPARGPSSGTRPSWGAQLPAGSPSASTPSASRRAARTSPRRPAVALGADWSAAETAPGSGRASRRGPSSCSGARGGRWRCCGCPTSRSRG